MVNIARVTCISVLLLSLQVFAEDSKAASSKNVEVVDGQIVLTLPKKVQFDFDSDEIVDFSSADKLAEFMLSNKVPLILTIEGHSDAVGTNAYNTALSADRAGKLKEYLISKGVPAAHIVTKAMSFSDKLENTSAPSLKNRRLELYLSYK